VAQHQACNQLGTPGGAKSLLRGGHFFKLFNTFFQGGENFSGGVRSTLVTTLQNRFLRLNLLLPQLTNNTGMCDSLMRGRNLENA